MEEMEEMEDSTIAIKKRTTRQDPYFSDRPAVGTQGRTLTVLGRFCFISSLSVRPRYASRCMCKHGGGRCVLRASTLPTAKRYCTELPNSWSSPVGIPVSGVGC